MRLIDADKLKRKAQKVGTEAWKMNLTAKVETTLNQFIDWIDEQPTIQPEKAQLSKESATSDLISRQAVLDALKEHRALYCDNTPETFSKLSHVEKSRVDELDTAIATLVNLPTIQPEPHWIPVSERLPEKSANYLVTVRWYREDDIEISVYEYNAWHKEWNDGESCGQRVIAWMPLPTPYTK